MSSFRQILRYCLPLHPCFRLCSQFIHGKDNLPKVNVIKEEGSELMKIYFKYVYMVEAPNNLNFEAEKDKNVLESLYRIKQRIILQRKREEYSRQFCIKYQSSESDDVAVKRDDDFNIDLFHNNKYIDYSVRNVDAWVQGALLKIGDCVYEVACNTPTVLRLKLPLYVLVGCYIRPHIFLQCSKLDDCEFIWYRLISNNSGNICSTNISVDKNQNWEKVGEGFTYYVCENDAGCKLKLECIPKMAEKVGPSHVAIMENAVTSPPESFPFEERHLYTKDLADVDSMRCISYNVLANSYVEKRRFPYASEKARDPYYRKQLLLRELLGYNSDIICLQEVQERSFFFDFKPVLQKMGFEGFYVKKGGGRQEGVASFFRASKFKIIHEAGVHLNKIVEQKQTFTDVLGKISRNYKDVSKLLAQDTALQIAILQQIDHPNNKILVANTHLYANKDMPLVRLIQAALCTSYIEHTISQIKDSDDIAVVFCGDFNSLPESSAFKFISSGHFECSSEWQNNGNSNGSILDTILRHKLCLDSACGIPIYTNYTEEFSGCLDYIFHTRNNLTVSEIVPFPNHEKVIEQVGLPSELFPSDHIALVCTLKRKNWNDILQ